ncbi:hypothetical protein ACQ3I4_07945 [Zafaria sp. Z1313]|uniref:hypothetical protein n=1 Tax=Zafaria sp. Z1313 TaxID=3423202 RepID=UPI003D30203D
MELMATILIWTALIVGAAALIRWVFVTRPRNELNEADVYIQRLNAEAAQHQLDDARKADELRRATTERTLAAQRAARERSGRPEVPTTRGPGISASRAAAEAAPSDPTAFGRRTAVDPTAAPSASNADYQAVLELVRRGQHIAAIKKVRQDTGISLTEAKQFIDSLAGK